MKYRHILIWLAFCICCSMATACRADLPQNEPAFISSKKSETAIPQVSQFFDTKTSKSGQVNQVTESSELSEEPSFEFSEAQKIIEDFFLGVWEASNEGFMIGITEESDRKDFFGIYGLLQEAYLTDTSAVIVCQNFISDRFQIEIDFCRPDILLFYDNSGKADGGCAKKYTRIGSAFMYPDAGIMNGYLMSMLYHCYGYLELSTDIGSYSTASVYFNGENAGKELTVLVSHNNEQIEFASSFMPLVKQRDDEIAYIQYTKIKNEGEWFLGDWSYVDREAIEKLSA